MSEVPINSTDILIEVRVKKRIITEKEWREDPRDRTCNKVDMIIKEIPK